MCQTGRVGKRQQSRAQIEAKIIELGRRQLVDHGAAGLSLRAIARDLGMVSSAVYRYVSSRDELLTLLLVDAYSELADTVDRARDTVSDLWSDDVIAIARAARDGRSRTPRGGPCCTAAQCPATTHRRNAPSESAPGWSAPSSTRSRPASPPATSG